MRGYLQELCNVVVYPEVWSVARRILPVIPCVDHSTVSIPDGLSRVTIKAWCPIATSTIIIVVLLIIWWESMSSVLHLEMTQTGNYKTFISQNKTDCLRCFDYVPKMYTFSLRLTATC